MNSLEVIGKSVGHIINDYTVVLDDDEANIITDIRGFAHELQCLLGEGVDLLRREEPESHELVLRGKIERVVMQGLMKCLADSEDIHAVLDYAEITRPTRKKVERAMDASVGVTISEAFAE